MKKPNVIGIPAAAEILGQSERTTQREAAADKLPNLGRFGGGRAGGAFLFDRDAIVAERDRRITAKRADLDALQRAAS